MSNQESLSPNPEPQAPQDVNPGEGGLAWTYEADKLYESGQINATEASKRSGIPHELPQVPGQEVEPAEPSPPSTFRRLSSGRPLTTQELRQRDVGSAAIKHKPTTYRNFTMERIARERDQSPN